MFCFHVVFDLVERITQNYFAFRLTLYRLLGSAGGRCEYARRPCIRCLTCATFYYYLFTTNMGRGLSDWGSIHGITITAAVVEQPIVWPPVKSNPIWTLNEKPPRRQCKHNWTELLEPNRCIFESWGEVCVSKSINVLLRSLPYANSSWIISDLWAPLSDHITYAIR